MNDLSPIRFHGSYAPEDVTFLLKQADIDTIEVDAKERLIQTGQRHYSEMLSAETAPSSGYMALYEDALARNAGTLHAHIHRLADGIIAREQTNRTCTLLSLARAGTPIGVLLKRVLEGRGIETAHYSISIIRGRGIDTAALEWIAQRHDPATAVFVDGWTGKGAITNELRKSLERSTLGFPPYLAVVADPAGCASLAATCDDYTVPSGILNAVVSGLVSRTVLSDAHVGPGEFHACRYLGELAPFDQSQTFIECVLAARPHDTCTPWSGFAAFDAQAELRGMLARVRAQYGIDDINRIKPGIAEATRAVLRRAPERVLVRDFGDPELAPLIHAAEAAGVPAQEAALGHYRALTIISNRSDN